MMMTTSSTLRSLIYSMDNVLYSYIHVLHIPLLLFHPTVVVARIVASKDSLQACGPNEKLCRWVEQTKVNFWENQTFQLYQSTQPAAV